MRLVHINAPREYLRLLEPIGIFTEDTKKYLYHSPQADELVSRFINKQKLSIGISPTAGNRIKEWPAERFAKVADYLSEKYQAMIVIIAGSNEEEEVKTMLGALNAKTNIINVAGRLSIDELKALASKLYLFISADTGPIYIAEAYGVPTIDIVGPVDEREQPPIGRLHKVIVPDRKKPELFVMNARVYDVVEARRQAELATVEQVINELEGMIISGCILLKKQL
jgi:ADP-heptose:LPS heptosyltransferase